MIDWPIGFRCVAKGTFLEEPVAEETCFLHDLKQKEDREENIREPLTPKGIHLPPQ